MPLQSPSIRKNEKPDREALSGVIAQAEAVAASNAARIDPSIGRDEVSASGSSRTPRAVGSPEQV